MADSAFSFHCMICVELFDDAERYPVVLPCGHTYVCFVCANRLDKCMECRTPLAWSIPTQSEQTTQQDKLGTASGPPHWSSARSGAMSHRYSAQHHPSGATPGGRHPAPTTSEKRRLPLPKNVVLLSLLEATEMATEHAARKKPLDASPAQSPTSGGSASLVEDGDGDDSAEKIKTAFSIAAGACGTYVVAHEEGLQIYPSRPTEYEPNEVRMTSHEDVDTLVRFFYLDQTLDTASKEEDPEKVGNKEISPAKLGRGDRVQIVSLDDGWGKLARGYGFVRAQDNGIVKVAGSVDKACKLEAMLRALSLRRKALSRQQSRVDTHFVGLMSDLQTSLINDEDLTVIPADTFGGSQASLETLSLTETAAAAPEARLDPEETSDSDFDPLHYPRKPLAFHRSDSPPLSSSLRGLCVPYTMFDVLSQPAPPAPPSTPLLSPDDDADPPSPSVLSAGARAWRERHGRVASQSIDFRTGMSGHHGLVSPQAHPHDYLGRTSRPMMSSYSGLTVTRNGKRRVKKDPSTP